MFEIIKTRETVPIWRYYRSLTLGRPACEAQAYNAVYPWIVVEGIYYHRSFETIIELMLNNERIPEYLQDKADIIKYIQNSILIDGNLRCGNYGMKEPVDINAVRSTSIALESRVAILGSVSCSWNNWDNTFIYTNKYNLGGDVVVSEEECVRLSQDMPLICNYNDLASGVYNMSGVNWNNVWVWED